MYLYQTTLKPNRRLDGIYNHSKGRSNTLPLRLVLLSVPPHTFRGPGPMGFNLLDRYMRVESKGGPRPTECVEGKMMRGET